MVEPHHTQRFCVFFGSFVCFAFDMWNLSSWIWGSNPVLSQLEAWSLTLNHQGSPPKVFEGGFINKICPCPEYRLIQSLQGDSLGRVDKN